MTRNNKVLVGIILLLLVGLSVSFAGDKDDLAAAKGALTAVQVAAAPRAGDDVYTNNPVVKIASDCSPAVVNIDTETMVTRRANPFADDPFFREFFGQEFERFNRAVPMRGKGSGFIVDKAGYILTNNHVVEGADKITVTMMDGRHFEADLIGKDPTFDLAVIQIKADDVPVLTLGDSDAAEIGEWVVAIGNPHGFENSVTAGIISAKNRTLQAGNINFQGFMQTDAAINPGNSGGPLINLKGEVVAINTAIVPYAQGIGFAVPVNMAKQIMRDLIENGEVKRGWLGIMLQDLTPGFAETYNVPVDEGAIIADVAPKSPADAAGLKRGDAISAIDGQTIKSSQDVVLYIRNKLTGDRVSVEIYRNGRKQTIRVRLGTASQSDANRGGERRVRPRERDAANESSRIGASVSEITPELKDRYEFSSDEGLVVLSVERGSVAAEIGLKAGDLILEVNRKKINRVSEWERTVSDNPDTLVLLLQRDGQTLFLTYKKQ
ncbi:MAG: Do family serine endopeptidase [Synergistaceae bacterium]|jgi:serine protease Do|nr:Do family serine endopeptidase [Synergistaceae bacterium]